MNKASPVILLSIFAAVFVSYIYFTQNSSNPNTTSRMFLTLSIVEDLRLDINKFQKRTVDKAFYDGNYYSDKAPGQSIIAVPSAYIGHLALQASGSKTNSIRGSTGGLTPRFKFYTRICTIFTSGLLGAIAVVVLCSVALRLGSSLPGAVFGALVFGLATPFWGWATSFFGHATSTSLLVLGLWCVLRVVQGVEKNGDLLFAFGAGACLTWAVVVDFTAAPVALLIFLYGLTKLGVSDGKQIGRVLAAGVSACGIFVLPLLMYNVFVFDSPFTVGYSNVQDFDGMKEGIFGLTSPKPEIMFEILLGHYRGILWLSPILAFGVGATVWLWFDRNYRFEAALISAIFIYYILFNSSYHYWHGGGSTGPRHITPMIPFLTLSLALLWTRGSKTLKNILVIVSLASFILSLICVSTTMYAPQQIESPLFDHLIPVFLDRLDLVPDPDLACISCASNLGGKWGIPAQLSVFPVLAVVAVLVLFLNNRLRAKRV